MEIFQFKLIAKIRLVQSSISKVVVLFAWSVGQAWGVYFNFIK
jgi:hypothetical protein